MWLIFIGGVVASEVKTPAKKEKNPPVPAGYTLDKNNVPYKKETGNYTVGNVKGNNVRDGYSTNSRITGCYLTTQQSRMTALIVSMVIDGSLILLIVDNVVILRQDR